MKCPNCSTILDDDTLQKCPVCGANLHQPQSQSTPVTSTTIQKKKVSRFAAWFVAWIGCGLILPMFIGDQEMFSRRIRLIVRLLPFCLVVVGFVLILICMLFWCLADQFNCIFGTLKYSDGTKVWR